MARFHCCTDFPAGLKLRAAELFPGGTTVPAAKPRLPPAAPQVTRALVVAAFDASKDVALKRGELCKAEVVAYLLADALGIEIIKEEAMRLGENATKDAVAAKDGSQKLKNVVSAKKAKLRKKAAKDTTIDLDVALEQLDKELADDLRKHWRAPCTPAGLPDAKSKVVESRPRPKPKPATSPAADICPRARRIMDMSESDEVATAVKRRRSCDGNLPHREGHQGQLLQRAAGGRRAEVPARAQAAQAGLPRGLLWLGAEICRAHGGLGGAPGRYGPPYRSRTASCKGPGPAEARPGRLYARVCVCRLCLSLCLYIIYIYVYQCSPCVQHPL